MKNLYRFLLVFLVGSLIGSIPVEAKWTVGPVWGEDANETNAIRIEGKIYKMGFRKNLLISGRDLESLPPEIGNLKDLVYLRLPYNKLKSLPKEIGELKNLSELKLTENELESLPKEIGNLKNLKSLDLSVNRLKSLPKEIEKLEKLESLDLSYNKLKSLPKEIEKLEKLESLRLDGNKNLVLIDIDFSKLSNLKELYLPFHLKNHQDLSGLEEAFSKGKLQIYFGNRVHKATLADLRVSVNQ